LPDIVTIVLFINPNATYKVQVMGRPPSEAPAAMGKPTRGPTDPSEAPAAMQRPKAHPRAAMGFVLDGIKIGPLIHNQW